MPTGSGGTNRDPNPPVSRHQPRAAEAAWEAHYKRIYPADVFSDKYMKALGRPAFIAAKKAGFLCGWEEATEARDQRDGAWLSAIALLEHTQEPQP